MVLEFEIQGLPKMTNGLRKHWRVIHRERKLWKGLVADAALNAKDCAARTSWPLSKAKVTITRFSATQPDYDGLVSAGKAILDGLVEAQVLIGDSPSVIGYPTYHWQHAPRLKGKISIRVEAIREAA